MLASHVRGKPAGSAGGKVRVSASVEALVITSHTNGKIIRSATGSRTRCQALGRWRRPVGPRAARAASAAVPGSPALSTATKLISPASSLIGGPVMSGSGRSAGR